MSLRPSSSRVLEPGDRISEVLSGLIMVLTFTGSLSVAEAGREDIRTMLVGALVFLSTFPVAVPFIVMQDTLAATRASNAVAVAMLFVAGAAYGRVVGRSPWVLGAVMVALGAVLVALTIALGG